MKSEDREYLDSLEKVISLALTYHIWAEAGLVNKSSVEYKDSMNILREAKKKLKNGLRVPSSYKNVIKYMKEIEFECGVSLKDNIIDEG